jgi:hypothetical protein
MCLGQDALRRQEADTWVGARGPFYDFFSKTVSSDETSPLPSRPSPDGG